MHPGENLAGPAGLDAGQLRLLAGAALASVALHLLLLYALPMLERAIRAPSAPALQARLAKPPPAPPAKAQAVPTPPPAPVARPPAPRPPVAAPRAESKPVMAAPAIAPVKPSAEPAPASSSAPAPTQQPAVAASAPAQVPVPASAGPDPGSVARYRLELMESARRYKRYPRVAQDNGWEGRVELRLAFAESGALSSLAVKKSAGRAALDDAALAMLRSAQAQTPVPVALRGKAFVLEIPVDFLLRDAER